jgi:hypothetical protein
MVNFTADLLSSSTAETGSRPSYFDGTARSRETVEYEDSSSPLVGEVTGRSSAAGGGE